MTIEAIESSVRHCYSTWSQDYYRDYYTDSAAYPPIHREIVRDELITHGSKSVLDAGCGPASMLRDLVDTVPRLYGFDLTPEMVDEARKVLAPHGVTDQQIWEGSVLEPNAFQSPHLNESNTEQDRQFDSTICIGVLPHVPEEHDATVMKNLVSCVRPGGLVIAEARNQLFSLFTLNRYSHSFFAETLINEDKLSDGSTETEQLLGQVKTELQERFRMELPPIREGKEDEPGYDEVLSRTHNPFELKQIAEEQGLKDVRIEFYHFHALPPMFESHNAEWFRQKSLQMERTGDWRGYFMASAFLVCGIKS